MTPTVLLADGDRELREIYFELLTSRGMQIETAADGLECVAKLRACAPDVLVLDGKLHWGGSDGVLAWLREQTARPAPPVILTSTAPPVEPPIVHFLSKPFGLADLLQGIHAATAWKRAEQPSSWAPARHPEFMSAEPVPAALSVCCGNLAACSEYSMH